ncbi:MAG: DNA topoisomerase IV subunit B, partial [Arenicellales bacterium]|nr:DNA topoisomerase IV subunit B [Arenicellales bacterium]
VNALSEYVHLIVHRDGEIHEQRYELGVPTKPMRATGKTKKTGTIIHFKPSKKIFSETKFKYETLANRLRELAFLNSGVNIKIVDQATNKKNVFSY